MTGSLAFLLILLALMQLFLRYYLVARDAEKISDTNGNKIMWWVNGSLALVAICIYFFVLKTTDHNAIKWFWLILLLIVMGFRAFMEWRYLKGSKEYIISLIILAFGIIYMLIFV